MDDSRITKLHNRETVVMATHAMATRFELILEGDDATHIRAVGEEAIQEIHRWSHKLNFFAADSDISRINRLASACSVRVDSELFDLLNRCIDLNHETAGAFDISIAPFMRAHGFRNQAPAQQFAITPTPLQCGTIKLDPKELSIHFAHAGTEIDLGGIAKGWALDRVRDILVRHRIARALVHGGTSSVIAIGRWNVGIRTPAPPEPPETPEPPESPDDWEARTASEGEAAASRPCGSISEIEWMATLSNTALSISAPHGRLINGKGHVIDPRTGSPASGTPIAAVVCKSASDAEAWSTALIVLQSHPREAKTSVSSLVAVEHETGLRWLRRGAGSHVFSPSSEHTSSHS